jgi:hypothetical protein
MAETVEVYFTDGKGSGGSKDSKDGGSGRDGGSSIAEGTLVHK